MSNSTGNSCPPREADALPPPRGSQWRIVGFVIGGLAVACAVFYLVCHRAEPWRDGRSLNEWLELAGKSRDNADGKAAEAAVRGMAPEAIPILVEMVGLREPAWWRPLCKWSKWTPLHLDPERYYRLRSRGLGGFWLLGRAAKSAGPALARLSAEPDATDEVFFALAGIGEVKSLLEAIPKSDAIRRAMIIDVLGTISDVSSEVFEVFRETLRSRDPVLRLAACEAAKSLGARAVQAMRPELEAAQLDADEHVREAAAAALKTNSPPRRGILDQTR
jgi:hypothetical protein